MHDATRGSSLAAALGMSAWTVPFCVLLTVHGGWEALARHGLPAVTCTVTLAFAILALHRAAVDHFGRQNAAVIRCLFGLMFLGLAMCAALVRPAQTILMGSAGAALGLEPGLAGLFLHWSFGLGAFAMGAVLSVPVLWQLCVGPGESDSGPELGPEHQNRTDQEQGAADEAQRCDGEPLVG